ncbi:hypothetical protein CS063_09875 [Sporanaerobium hydrogeniformans]|uniref:Uncharacterized protein n=1 Tax=Sporanaerobium hydrogeniformans TaxID=3072179 RepID=A0AC61DCV3_9FIRM|nr:TetR/AcrR family transcriptional regulator [Sporanaerobium hydrogeniformans]PHV70600.1 hypothetical protein CS063_09875 [Sporanaerobium hydrogeniformans]
MPRKKEIDKREILKTVEGQFSVEESYFSLDMKKIAKMCDMSIGTLYKYYPTKDDLVNDLLIRQLKKELAYTDILRGRYEEVSRALSLLQNNIYLSSQYYEGAIFYVYLKDRFSKFGEYFNELYKYVYMLLNEAGGKGQIKRNIDKKEISHLIVWNILIGCLPHTTKEQATKHYLTFIDSLGIFQSQQEAIAV